jgi:hypothetical protein
MQGGKQNPSGIRIEVRRRENSGTDPEPGVNSKRNKKVKKDIFAALTFLMTGLIFYVVQTDSKVDELISNGTECEAVGTVIAGESISETAMDLTFQGEATRDS